MLFRSTGASPIVFTSGVQHVTTGYSVAIGGGGGSSGVSGSTTLSSVPTFDETNIMIRDISGSTRTLHDWFLEKLRTYVKTESIK